MARSKTWHRSSEPTRVWHVEPGRVGHSVEVDIGPGQKAILLRCGGKDLEDGEKETEQPGSTHAKEGLEESASRVPDTEI